MYRCELCSQIVPPGLSQKQLQLTPKQFYTQTLTITLCAQTQKTLTQDELVKVAACDACEEAWSARRAEARQRALVLAADPCAAPATLSWLSDIASQDEELLSMLAQNPNTPPEALDKLAARFYPLLLQNPSMSLLRLENPAGCHQWRLCYAERCLQEAPPKVSSEDLRALSAHPTPSVRRLVALHPNTEPEILRLLAADKDEWVRQAVAQNPHSPVEVLRLLASDRSRWVLRTIAIHPNLPPKVQKAWLEDDSLWRRDWMHPSPGGWYFWLEEQKPAGPFAPKARRRQATRRKKAAQQRTQRIVTQKNRRSLRKGQNLQKKIPKHPETVSRPSLDSLDTMAP